MDIQQYNGSAWDKLASEEDQWTIPVDADTIARARQGDWSVQLTSVKATPRHWFPEDLQGLLIRVQESPTSIAMIEAERGCPSIKASSPKWLPGEKRVSPISLPSGV